MKSQFFTDTATVSSNRVLYTASSFARSSLLHLQEIGELEALKAHTSERSGLQSYLFFMVVCGSGRLVYEDKEQKLEAGSVVFIDCRKSYSHRTDPENLWKLKWIHFYGPTINSIYEKYCERGGRAVFTPASSTAEQMEAVWNQLMSVASSDLYMRDMLINQYLAELIMLLMSESWHPEEKRKTSKRTSALKRASVLDVKEWIDAHYADDLTLDGLAAQFYINKYYLAKTFKAQFGSTIQNYITSIRITHAKQLLRFSDQSIEEIGLITGIGTPDYFSRVFKEVEGVPPSVYRKQW